MTTKAVLLDALGTLVELEPPWVHLAASSGSSPTSRVAALRAEMAYYREHAHEATRRRVARRAAGALRRAALARARARRSTSRR